MAQLKKRDKKDITPVKYRVNAVPVYMDELNSLIDEVNPIIQVFSDVVPSPGKVAVTDGIQVSPTVTEFTKDVNLTAANLQAMQATPIVVVPAEGTGYAFDFVSAVLVYDSTATAYANGGAITINYAGGAAVSTTLAATFLTAANNKVWNLQKLNAANGYTMPVNTGLAITNAAAPFITGTGVCRLKITYRRILTEL